MAQDVGAGVTNADRLKRLRQLAKARGDCGTCRARPARDGKMTCQECVNRSAATKKRLAGVRCGRCSGELGERSGMLFCGPCAEHLSVVEASRRRDRKQSGICAVCGKEKLSTTAACARCADKNRDRAILANRLRGAKPRTCRICGMVGHDRSGHDRMMDRAKEWAR